MLNARNFEYKPFQDSRQRHRPGFTEGSSGPLLIATYKKTKERFIVKHTYPHNAANEFAACWLAGKIGVPAPQAYLLSKEGPFASKYAVAISFIEDLTSFEKRNVPPELQNDRIGQFALNRLIATDDIIQLKVSGNHIYSYDFSESFYISDEILLQAFRFSEDIGIEMVKQKLGAFRNHLQIVDFDVPRLAAEFNIDPEKQRNGMTATAKRVLDISETDIQAMSDELMKIYPVGYAVYYVECIHEMQKHVSAFMQRHPLNELNSEN